MKVDNVENLKEFRVLYNKLDDLLSQKSDYKEEIAFTQKLKKFIQIYPSYEWLKSEIKQIHDLRNVLVHEEKYQENIAIPTDSLLKRLKGIIKTIQNPQTALDIASTEIYSCEPSDRIIDVIKVMADKLYSVVPVFTNKKESKEFLGVFSESSLMCIVGKKEEVFCKNFSINSGLLIKDILDIIEKPIRESWAFISATYDVLKIQKLFHTQTFENASQPNSRLGVLFVTKNGKKDEEILGLITAWDLSKINENFIKIASD